jgi:hypothetical protein
MDNMQNYRDQLASRLQQSPVSPLDAGLRALAWALMGHPTLDPAACAPVQAVLPEYVEAEIGGDLNLAGSEQSAVYRHLLLCPECGRLHARLLQVAWLLARDELPRPAHRPAPRLPFGGRSA